MSPDVPEIVATHSAHVAVESMPHLSQVRVQAGTASKALARRACRNAPAGRSKHVCVSIQASESDTSKS